MGRIAAGYDENGSLTSRVVDGAGYLLSYDADNRLVEVKRGATVVASLVYDGDSKRVKATFGTTTFATVGNHFEEETTGTTVRYRKYYYAGRVRIAMRDGTTPYLILTDHLGSTTAMADLTTGARTSELWYRPWGEYRGTPFGATPTIWRFTGQREDATIGLYFYNARCYDPVLGRFTQADTIVPQPGNPQALNR